MAELLSGKYSQAVESYEILDCRYPYEYSGGHIVGAQSWDTPQFVIDRINKVRDSVPAFSDSTRRKIMIFHCEFSAERGPTAQRLLREQDRCTNTERYPSLHYPELYLLEGGYKAFFEKFPEFCVPRKYTKMVDHAFAHDLKEYRSRSKTWAAENKMFKGGRTGTLGKKSVSKLR